ncbi:MULTISPECIES: CHASE2 domain-containing protein [Thalassospira]|uniref:Adenylate/guanylate cyclase domain-containing protein n=1 Tax=Thalassospira aquimaris TaxID=3037796 RepID=A0ABT6G8L3_9PROT|nr:MULTISPECIES: adenylate/guanylate cyclase domain-containing protein [Thalassospira]MDG4718406.1 adenylate/guanylate cyclase domain-containing protein [Thalassospira sp. FZY0004]
MRLSKSGLSTGLQYLVPLAILFTFIVLRWQNVPVVDQLRLTLFDVYQQIAPRQYEDVGVRIVDIDEHSLEEQGQWPWPRTRLAQLLYKLRASGAVVVGFDMVFAEPDRTSPSRVIADWPQSPEQDQISELAKQLPDHDQLFAQFIAGTGNVVTAVQLRNGAFEALPRQVGNFSAAGEAGRVLSDFVPVLPSAAKNLDVIEGAATGNALINVSPEQDGIVRRVPLLAAIDDDQPVIGKPVYPTLTVEMLRVLQNAPKTMLVRMSGASGSARWTNSEGIASVRVGAITIPTDHAGNMWVHFTGHRPDRYLSATDILDGTIPAETLQNKMTVVGTSAAGLLDLRSSPLNRVIPGAEIHAEMLEQMLLEHFLTRPYWAAEIEMLSLLLVGLFFIIAVPRLGAIWPAIIGLGIIAGALGVSWWAYTDKLLLIDPLYPIVSLIAVYLATSSLGFMRTEGERRQVRAAFANYLSPALVEQLAQHPEQLKLGGETRDMTLMFCDVRGFTSISEGFKSNPQGLTQLINRLLTPLTECILDREGTIDKYMGDCIMAFWNAPLDVERHAHRACDSALAMFEALDVLNAERLEEANRDGQVFLPLNIGIGINCGECLVGNMGSEQRFDYSVLGDAVNLASRLEGQSKNYGVNIVLGEDTAQRVEEDFATLELDLIAVKGKTEAVHIFTLLGAGTLRSSDAFTTCQTLHVQMLDAYRSQKWDLAEDLIAKCREASRDVGALSELYDMYVERIATFREAPPPAEWDGVFVANSK